ncbi:MAG: TRAP transporter large permease [Pseudomonadota bacterium]
MGDTFILALLGFKLVLLFIGFPIAFSAILISLIYILAAGLPLSLAAQKVSFTVANFTLLAIPLFMFAGKLMTASGISDRIFDFAQKLVGRVPGGLGHVNVVSSLIFAGMSGSALADVAGLGEIEYKAMTRKGYDPDFTVGVTLSSSAIGPILPPSLPMVLYGVASGTSITGLFLGGVLPGLLIALMLMMFVFVIGLRRGYRIDIWEGWRALLIAFIRALPPLFTPVIIVGGMAAGIFSPTEAATVTVLYALFIAVIVYRELNWRGFATVVYEVVISTSKLLFIIATALLLGWILTVEQVPQRIAEFTATTITDPTTFWISVLALMLVLGAIIENAMLLLILAPMLAPIAESQFGIDPIQFGVCMVFSVMIGQYTPPIGLSLFVMRGITGFSLGRVSWAVAPFLLPLVLSLLVMAMVPSIILSIPKSLGF